MINKKLVIEKSRLKILKENKDSISNCSKGAYNIFGIKGFEPLNDRTKNECLSTWLYSK